MCVCEGREAGKVGSEFVMREEAGYRDAHVPKNFKIINKVCPVTTASPCLLDLFYVKPS